MASGLPEQQKLDDRRLLIGLLIFIVALILRLAYVNTLVIDHPIRADAEKYFHLAYNLAINHSYSLANTAPFISSTYITPGYPLFLTIGMKLFANFDAFYRFILNFQALIDSVSVVLIYSISVRVMPVLYAGLSGLLVALSPHLIAATGYFLTETLFTFFLILTIFFSVLALKNKSIYLWVTVGLLCAFASLIRPVLLLYPAVLIIIQWRLSKDDSTLKWAGYLLLGFILVWSPWHFWKSQNFNANEPNLAPAAFALGIYPDFIFKDPKFQGFPYRDDPDYEDFSTSFPKTISVLLERAQQEPAKFVKWYVWGKPMMFWQADNNMAAAGGPFIYDVETSMYHKIRATTYTLFAIMKLHPYLIMLCMVSVVFFLREFLKKSQNFIEGYVCSALILYFTAIHTVLAPLPRYSYPVIPFAYLLACFMLYQVIKYAKSLLKKDE